MEATLAPWLRVLAPVTRPWLVPGASSLAPQVRGLVVAPYPRLATGLHVQGQLQAIRCALEIVALALRVEPRVWGWLHDQAGATRLDLEEFDAEELGCELQIECPAGQAGSSMCFELGAPEVEDYPPTVLNEQYEASLRRLRRLDTSRRLDGYRIPMGFNVIDPPSNPPIVLMLYELAYGLSLDTSGEVVTRATPFRPPTNGVSVRVGVDQIASITAMGIPITHVQMEASALTSDEVANALKLAEERTVTTQPAIALSVNVRDASDAYVSFGGGERIHSLTITIDEASGVAVVVQALARSYVRYEALQSVTINCARTLNSGDLDAIENELGTAMSSQSRDSTPERPIQTFSLSVTVESAECARRLMWLVIKCLPREITSLSLSLAVAEDRNARYGEVLSTIVRTFAQLSLLRLWTPFRHSISDLADSYKSVRCRIRSLSLNSSASDILPHIRALADPTAHVFHVLEELSVSLQSETDALVEAICVMLRTNRKLQYLELAAAHSSSLQTRLQKSARAALLTRRKLAFLSVVLACDGNPDTQLVHRFDELVVGRIVSFAEAPRRCRVVVRDRD